MSENQPGPLSSNSTPGPAAVPDLDGEMQTRIATAPFQLSQEPLNAESATDALASIGAATAPAYEHLGELPSSYGTQSVYLVAYDPRQLFVYWDLAPTGAAEKKYSLHICYPDGGIENRVDIQPTEAGRYLTAARPGGTYYVELGTYSRNGVWQPVAASGRVTLPAEGLAGDTEPKFATLPFHLSFQRLMELIEGAMGNREDLTSALARLQRGERPAVASLLGALSHLSVGQLHTLELLLGQKFALDSQTSSSAGGASRYLSDRQEAITSPGQSSEAFSAAAGGGSETLSSAGAAFGSESLSSGALAAGGSEGLSSSRLSSEVTLQPLSSESVSSFSGLMGSETVSSFTSPSSNESLISYGTGPGSESLLSYGAGLGSESVSSFSGTLGGESLSSFTHELSSESLASFTAGLSSESLASGGFGSQTLLSLLAGMSSESLSSFFSALAAGGGSESLSSGMFAGPSSEAWRMAGAGAGLGGSDLLSSEHAAIFLHAVENNLDVLGSLFSHGFSSLESLASPGAGGSYNSESVARSKSLW